MKISDIEYWRAQSTEYIEEILRWWIHLDGAKFAKKKELMQKVLNERLTNLN